MTQQCAPKHTETLRTIRRVHLALGAPHGERIFHRNVKPANLLLDKRGTVTILELGLAGIESSNPEHDKTISQELTQAGSVMGTVVGPGQMIAIQDTDVVAGNVSLRL